MKTLIRRSAFFALIGLVLLPLAVAHASPPPADSVHFCQLIDFEQWERDSIRPVAKRLAGVQESGGQDNPPPFWGTVWIDPDIITPSDPTALEDITAAGRGQRTMFDRRVKDWITINAYLFNARFDDGLTTEIQVNPEFGSVSAAMVEANKYGRAIGQLPTILRTDVETVWIHKGEGAGGGNNNILIHADDFAFDEESDGFDFMEEVLVHEGAHASLDPSHATDPDWIAAQEADGNYISIYARDYPQREDIAESFLLYLAVRYRSARISQFHERTILETIPNRIAYFDRLLQVSASNDMHPITEDLRLPQTSTDTVEDEQQGSASAQLAKVSGDNQQGLASAQLARPFVVSVLDQDGSPLTGAVVSFSITAGGGTLSAATVTTDANGRARSTLTLGSEPGTNTVVATVAGLEPETFTATAIEQIPHSLTKVSGDGQEGLAGVALAAPFVVSVSDEDGAVIAGAVVTFSVTAGEGVLSVTTTTTDANGQATTALTLTLGSDTETNTVSATVAGLESVTFTATAVGQAIPDSLAKVSGDGQEGTVDELLAEPFVVSVLAEDGAAIAGAVVSFSVTAGGGTLSDTTATTNANGQARSRLTLGSELGTNTVEATVEGLESVTFTATGQESPLADFFDFFWGGGKRVALPDRTQLLQNAPNPFNSETVLSYFLLEPGPVRLEVFALSGQRVAVLHQGLQQAGYHRLHWDGSDDAGHPVASGTYLYRLMTDETVLTRKLTLLR